MTKHFVGLFMLAVVGGCGDQPATQGSSSAAKASGSAKATTSAPKASASAAAATTSAAPSGEASAAPAASGSAAVDAGGAVGTGEGFDSAEALAKHVVGVFGEMKPEDVKKSYPTDA